jgi:hypothetical protein
VPIANSGTAGKNACLFGVLDMEGTDPADDGGESVAFTLNSHMSSSIPADGRVFCVTRGDGKLEPVDAEAVGVPVWGNPTGCMNRDGLANINYEDCL